MPKKIDPALRERAVRLVLQHRAEYLTTMAQFRRSLSTRFGVER